MSDERRWQELEERIAAIAAEGRAVRDRVAEAVAATVAGMKGVAGGVEEVVRRTARGGVDGAKRATEESARGVLGAVVDGAGDGLARSALAARLAFDEAKSRGKAFAKRDLELVVKGVGDAGRSLADAFGKAAAEAGDELASQVSGVREHAERTGRQIEPGLRAALDAVRDDPLGLAVDTARAGTGAARAAAGELFDAVGALLGEAAKRLRKE